MTREKKNPAIGQANARRAPARRLSTLWIDGEIGTVSTCSIRPRGARWIYVFGHGAGAGMHHPFIEEISSRLAARGVATFRYQFPYMEAGRKRPDHARVLQATVRAALTRVCATSKLPVIAGGKSMGGRMTSLTLASEAVPGVAGVAFIGFPLHPPERPGYERAAHLDAVSLPMLFLQGTRDALAGLARVRRVIRGLGSRATLHVVRGADHAFHVLRRSGSNDEGVKDRLADALVAWGDGVVAAARPSKAS